MTLRSWKKKLEKKGVFNDLRKMAQGLGINGPKDLVRVDETIPKLQETWKGGADDVQLLILYLESAKTKAELLNKLNEVRTLKAQGS